MIESCGMNNFPICTYCVVFVDLMGHKRFLSELECCVDLLERQRRVNEISVPLRRFKDGIKQRVCEALSDTRNIIRENVKGESQEAMLNMVDDVSFGVQQFSDSTLVYVKMVSLPSYIALLMVIEFIAFRMLDSMGCGVPIRGGMAIGQGWEIDKDCLCGQVIADAYKLESNVSNWGRITVSSAMAKAFRSLKLLCNGIPNGNFYELLRPMVEMVAEDIDGVKFLDYLNPAVEELYKREHFDSDWFVGRIKSGIDFVNKQIGKFRTSAVGDFECAKLALRYEPVRDYWRSRLDMWSLRVKQ